MVEMHATTGHSPLRIEDLNPRELVAALNLSTSPVAYNAAKLGGFPSLSRVPEALEIHASAAAETVERTTLDWATLQGALGPELSARVWAAAERYGYKDLAVPFASGNVTQNMTIFVAKNNELLALKEKEMSKAAENKVNSEQSGQTKGSKITVLKRVEKKKTANGK